MEIKDFKVGQTVWVELTGNASRGKHGDELIEEWEVVTVGKKYIHAQKKGCDCPIKFEKRKYGNSPKFVEKTNYCVGYILYVSKIELEEKLEYHSLYNDISRAFGMYGNKRLSLEQLRKIKAILEEQDV